MKTILLLTAGLLVYVTNLLAAPAPSQSEKLLWNVGGDNRPREARHICMTTKNPPFNQILCLGENVKSSGESAGFILKRTDKNVILDSYQIVGASEWTYLYRTNEYVSNADYYTRSIVIKDKFNRKSVLTEVFAYYDESDHSSKHILTITLKGNLPDGTKVNLDNGYFFYP